MYRYFIMTDKKMTIHDPIKSALFIFPTWLVKQLKLSQAPSKLWNKLTTTRLFFSLEWSKTHIEIVDFDPMVSQTSGISKVHLIGTDTGNQATHFLRCSLSCSVSVTLSQTHHQILFTHVWTQFKSCFQWQDSVKLNCPAGSVAKIASVKSGAKKTVVLVVVEL